MPNPPVRDCGCRGTDAILARGGHLPVEAPQASTMHGSLAARPPGSPPTPPEPPHVDLPIIPTGTQLLPDGETGIVLCADPARLHAGLPAIVIKTGMGYRTQRAAYAVKIHGPSTIGQIAGLPGIALRTAAAVEVC